MRWSRYPINTTKETPSEAEVISHQLMLRAGLIRRLAAGLHQKDGLRHAAPRLLQCSESAFSP